MNTQLKKQYIISGCAYLGQIVTGYGLGWTAPILPKLQDIDQTPLDDVITDQQSALVGSITFIGSLLSPFVSGYLSNTVGRKPCLLVAGVVSFISFLLLALAKSIAVIYVGRLFCGLGGSVVLIVNLVYIGEIASPNIRGLLLTLTGFFSTFGIVLIYVIGPYVSYSATSWIPAAMTAVYIVGVYFMPESPVFQVMAGKKDEAIDNLTSLGREKDIDDVIATVIKDEEQRKNSKSKIASFGQIYTIKSNRKALFILLVLNILQQLSGFYSLTLFVTTVFELSGSNMDPHISTIITGLAQLIASLVAPFFVENIGRKILLISSTAISAISLAVLAIYFYLYNSSHSIADSLQWVTLTALIIYFFSFCCGLGIIPNTFAGEMFSTNVRSIGTSLSLTVSWLFSFGVSTAFGYMVPAWGAQVTFGVYAGACALAFVFSIVYVPETKGKTLLEIQEMLDK